MTKKKKKKERTITTESTKPCGCHVIVYSDDTKECVPCPPCGFLGMAKELQGVCDCLEVMREHFRRASNAIGSTAVGLRKEEKRQMMQAIADAAALDTKGPICE